MTLPDRVRIVEVGPRDGLQNEQASISTADKIALVDGLSDAGVGFIEVGSFVSPKWVPQMADSAAVFAGIQRRPQVVYAALTPNVQGFEAALAAGASQVAVFAAASESFSQKNINCSVAESLKRFEPLMAHAQAEGIQVRGYVSCVLGCPYEGEVAPSRVRDVSQALWEMGCYEVSLGDTIGVGTAGQARRLIEAVSRDIPRASLAGHFHDTYGQALANIYACLLEGISVFDSAIGGLGGCPYAKGATGNVATEDVLYLLQGLGIETGIDLPRLIAVSRRLTAALGKPSGSRVTRARGG
ncbi:hydroxymethylglutaryl-CoA lyase [Pseudomonas baltica]|uniref:hydroxymethylglutaryl-CoA lyase n=1 Tax=Pseudomonas baltica TaxID=2762576 RepID=UPI00289A1285|nr:hydroxymethylglutaryl-CoA lyase [Pseudomonas baltica]